MLVSYISTYILKNLEIETDISILKNKADISIKYTFALHKL